MKPTKEHSEYTINACESIRKRQTFQQKKYINKRHKVFFSKKDSYPIKVRKDVERY